MTATSPLTQLLNNTEAAERIGVQPNTLEIWRGKGKGPKYIKMDPHSLRSRVRYRESDVLEWLEARTCTNTSQYPTNSSIGQSRQEARKG